MQWFSGKKRTASQADASPALLQSPTPAGSSPGVPPKNEDVAASSPAAAASGKEPGSADASAEARAVDWRLLFVGGDAAWFAQLERDLHSLEPGWLCRHAQDNAQALGLLSEVAFHVLVLDAEVAEGTKLLDWIEALYPETLRLVRCNTRDRAAVSEWTRGGLATVAADADAATLAASLKRTARLQAWMADPALKRLLPSLRKLPVLPKLHSQLTEELRSADSSIETIAQIISQDPAMAAKVLQMVNSAFFGLSHQVTDVAEAVMILGTERIRSLVLLAGIFSQFDNLKIPNFSAPAVWNHSLQVGAYARTIAMAETRDPKLAEAAFTAGLLHDFGKLIVAGNLPDMLTAMRQLQQSEHVAEAEAEMQILGTSHAEVGACLLGTWGLPLPILEAVAWHHYPQRSDATGFSPVAAVHAANVFAQETGADSGPGGQQDCLNLPFLKRIGLADRPNLWRAACDLPERPDEPNAGTGA